ncbi:hypothetical protein PCURB6_10250 [Paenibacillus curdlanolyticus]|nr:hypothetical protein PCURB6_10250 [Paenibacillus curdlanolyticus]
MERYGNYFAMEFPNVELDVVPLNQISGDKGQLHKLVREENFDLIFLKETFQYDDILQQNLLSPIDSLFKNYSDWVQPVLEKFKREGTLYGYPISYYVDAVYINQTCSSKAEFRLWMRRQPSIGMNGFRS